MSQTLMRVTREMSIEVPGLGRKIKDARESSPRTLASICKEVDMSPMNWYRIENEKQSLPEEKLRKIEQVLNIDLGVNFDV